MSLQPIIQVAELVALQQTAGDNLVIVDASNHKDAKANYDAKHLDGAIFVDSNKQLANIGENAAQGGRHPLPTLAQFAQALQDLGITPNSHVVIYDDKNGANSAARFWWMLQAVGHPKVQVLNGGLQEAVKQGFPTNDKVVEAKAVGAYPVDAWLLPTATIDAVEANSEKPNYLVIDVREPSRYKGHTEPIDQVAGHIPGAVNIPFMSNLDANGLFLSPNQLKDKYTTAFEGKEEVIVHCGSGITACHTLLAIASAGMEIPKLYVGSWSEWSRNDKPIVTEE